MVDTHITSLFLQTRADPVKAKILELIQVWSHAFRNEASYKAVQDTYHLMKMEGNASIFCSQIVACFIFFVVI